MSIANYSDLSTAIGSWSTRTYTSGQIDNFIGLFEAGANRRLGPNHRRQTTSTLDTDSVGEAALPGDFLTMRSVIRDVVGSVPLTQCTWDQLLRFNPNETSDDSVYYAIRGTTFKVSQITDDVFNIVYDAALTGISSNNTTGWLLSMAPDAYLFGCLAQQQVFEEEYEKAAVFQARSDAMLDALTAQSNVALYGNAELVIDGITP